MGRTSIDSAFNLPGRVAWSVAESVGPLNLIYILYTLPSHLPPLDDTTPSSLLPITTRGLFGTGLPLTHEIMGALYILHYINRAIITPWFGAPSMSPIHLSIAIMMATFQYFNSTSLGGWLCYDAQQARVNNRIMTTTDASLGSLFTISSAIGIVLFTEGFLGNIGAEWTLFKLRRDAAKRKAKAEGRATVTYDKVYVIPEATGWFKYVMFPHYSLEWVEWTGYWVLGWAWGLGWSYNRSAALMFLVNEFAAMTPRAHEGLGWYEKRFGKRPLEGRKAVVPGIL